MLNPPYLLLVPAPALRRRCLTHNVPARAEMQTPTAPRAAASPSPEPPREDVWLEPAAFDRPMSGLGDAFSVEESPSSADDSDGIEVAVVRLGVEVLGEAEEAEFDDSELVEETVVCWVGFAGSAGRTLSEYRTLLYP